MPAQKNGWFIKVCTTRLKQVLSTSLLASAETTPVIEHGGVGTATRKPNSMFQRTCETFRNLDQRGRGSRGPNVHMCVCFRNHVTKKMEFDRDEEHETSQTDSDSCGC